MTNIYHSICVAVQCGGASCRICVKPALFVHLDPQPCCSVCTLNSYYHKMLVFNYTFRASPRTQRDCHINTEHLLYEHSSKSDNQQPAFRNNKRYTQGIYLIIFIQQKLAGRTFTGRCRANFDRLVPVLHCKHEFSNHWSFYLFFNFCLNKIHNLKAISMLIFPLSKSLKASLLILSRYVKTIPRRAVFT